MTSVEEAQEIVIYHASPLPPCVVSLDESLGYVLARDVYSDIDSPPYDKSLMDGFAVRSTDLTDGRGELTVVGQLVAGDTPWPADRALNQGQAVRIMTGAPIPHGADAVVMIERTSTPGCDAGSPTRVSIDAGPIRSGQNIMRRGAEMRRGDTVLRAGTRIRPPESGVLATVGAGHVAVHRRPQVAIVSTGNEIVETSETPGPGQIRNSNGPMLSSLVCQAGATPRYLGIARDSADDLRRLVADGLRHDILLLSGGVSAGDLDLVPGVLQSCGVVEVFHKVHLKPGKPVWFGTTDPSTLVFGLPGNPVSVMVCFELFVRPAIRRAMGRTDAVEPLMAAAIEEDREYRSDRPTYWPARLASSDAGLRVRPMPWQGSPDLRAITAANSLVVFPPGEYRVRQGDLVRVHALGD